MKIHHSQSFRSASVDRSFNIHLRHGKLLMRAYLIKVRRGYLIMTSLDFLFVHITYMYLRLTTNSCVNYVSSFPLSPLLLLLLLSTPLSYLFSVAGPRVWNDLPQELRLFPKLCTDTFLGHLKTYFFVRTGVGSASE